MHTIATRDVHASIDTASPVTQVQKILAVEPFFIKKLLCHPDSICEHQGETGLLLKVIAANICPFINTARSKNSNVSSTELK